MNLYGYRFTKIMFDNPAIALRVRKMVFLKFGRRVFGKLE